MGIYYYVVNMDKRIAFDIGKHEPMEDPNEVFDPLNNILGDDTFFFKIEDFKERKEKDGLKIKDIQTALEAFDILEPLMRVYSFHHLLALLFMYLWPDDWKVMSEYEFEPTRGWRVIE